LGTRGEAHEPDSRRRGWKRKNKGYGFLLHLPLFSHYVQRRSRRLVGNEAVEGGRITFFSLQR